MSSLAPRCLNCGYFLQGLESSVCPECGRAFDLRDQSSYSLKPLFSRFRFWLPGFLLALLIGLIFYVLLISTVGFGWTVTLFLPICLGALIGYGCRLTPRFLLYLLAGIMLAGVVIGLFSLSIVGVFCGAVLAAVAFVPLLVGTFLGWTLRALLKSSSWDQRWHLPAFMIVLIPLISGAIEAHFAHPYADETVGTTIVMPVSADRAWDALMFYEEVHGRPPLLMRIALPRPLYTRGSTQHVGNLKVCVYNKGRLVKRVTRRTPDSNLTFDVVEQTRIENRSVALKSGSFGFESLGANQARVTLTTTYRPLLGPRWAWRWAERLGIRTLHTYVLEGMQRKAIVDNASGTAVARGDGS